jgi:ribosomal protein L6P/L9E
MPVAVPTGVEVEINGAFVRVKGPKGQMEHTFPSRPDENLEGR